MVPMHKTRVIVTISNPAYDELMRMAAKARRSSTAGNRAVSRVIERLILEEAARMAAGGGEPEGPRCSRTLDMAP